MNCVEVYFTMLQGERRRPKPQYIIFYFFKTETKQLKEMQILDYFFETTYIIKAPRTRQT